MIRVRLRQPAGIDRLAVEPDAAIEPSDGDIVVRVRASSINYHDYGIATGALPAADGRILLSDGAGEIIAVGAGATQFKPGDRVVSTFFPDWIDGDARPEYLRTLPGDRNDGFARTQVTMPETAFTRIPRGYSDEEAATLTCAGLTAWRALIVNGRLRPGETVLVQGSGGVSIFALQFAKAAGATVIATSSCPEKLERLRALGADHVINYRDEPQWARKIQALTGGIGVDHVVEVGGAGTLEQSIRAARPGGHIAIIGVLAGRAGPVPNALVMAKQLRMIGLTVGSRRHQEDMIAAIEASGIRPVIDSRFPLDRLADAFRHQESGRHFGKIAIEI